LLGNGGFHRYEPSVNLMRLILFFFYYRCSNTEGSQVGDQAWEEVRWNAQRALGANPEMHRSKDESDNVKATAELRKWLEAAWTPGADTRSAA
jgi:hypothetical protein